MPPGPRWYHVGITKGKENSDSLSKTEKRLLKAGGELGELKQDFYSQLLKQDFSTMEPVEAVKTLASAFDTYYAGKDPSIKHLRDRAPEFLDVLIRDKKDAEEAKRSGMIRTKRDYGSIVRSSHEKFDVSPMMYQNLKTKGCGFIILYDERFQPVDLLHSRKLVTSA